MRKFPYLMLMTLMVPGCLHNTNGVPIPSGVKENPTTVQNTSAVATVVTNVQPKA